MIQGAICELEEPKTNRNLLTEFCNFDRVHAWNITDGSATVNTTISKNTYAGKGSINVTFLNNAEVRFTSGGSEMEKVVRETGMYFLSFAVKKSDDDSDIVFTVQMYVNGSLLPQNTIYQDLFDSSGYVNGQWNIYYQNVYLEDGDVVDFAFVCQSDTTGAKLYIDRMKLEYNDRGLLKPSLYSPAELEEIEEENILTIGEIAGNSSLVVTASLTGANTTDTDKKYVTMRYPSELLTLGLVVGEPLVTATNVVKFVIHNHSGSPVTPTEDAVYNFKLIRQ